MSKLQQWVAFAVVGVLVVLAAGWFLLVSPQRSKATALSAQVVTEQGATASLRTELDVVRAQAQQLPAKQAELAKFARQIPAKASLPALIRSLTDAASSAHVDLVSIAPGPPVPYTPVAAAAPARLPPAPSASPSPGAVTTPVPVTPATAPLQSIPLAVKVNGTYVQMEQFLANLEGLQRIFLVNGYTIGSGTPVKPAATTTAGSGTTGGCSSTPCNLDLALTGQVFIAPVAAAPSTPVTLK